MIDESNRSEHWYLGGEDDCYFIWERMSGLKSGWDHYPANNFIANLQIPVTTRYENPERFKYKAPAIGHAALAVGKVRSELYAQSVFVPMPPSTIKGEAGYDDRLVRVLNAVVPRLDVRELIVLTENVLAKAKGLNPEDRAHWFAVDESLAEPEPEVIVVFDDLLTTGSHFKAAKMTLEKRFPDALVQGLFLARAVRPPDPQEDLNLW